MNEPRKQMRLEELIELLINLEHVHGEDIYVKINGSNVAGNVKVHQGDRDLTGAQYLEIN